MDGRDGQPSEWYRVAVCNSAYCVLRVSVKIYRSVGREGEGQRELRRVETGKARGMGSSILNTSLCASARGSVSAFVHAAIAETHSRHVRKDGGGGGGEVDSRRGREWEKSERERERGGGGRRSDT